MTHTKEALKPYTTPPAAQPTWAGGGDLEDSSAYQTSQAQPAPVQEPVAWAKFLHYPECWNTAAYPTLHDAIHEALAWSGCSVCTPPAAQRPWVGLTDDEIAEFDWQHATADAECVRAIETLLKQRNT